MRSRLGDNKRGFGTAMTVVAGVISLLFLLVFAFIFADKLTDSNLLPDNSVGKNATDLLVGNFSEGVNEINTAIPTVLGIAVFVLIITVLIIAFVVARRNGLIGQSQLG